LEFLTFTYNIDRINSSISVELQAAPLYVTFPLHIAANKDVRDVTLTH